MKVSVLERLQKECRERYKDAEGVFKIDDAVKKTVANKKPYKAKVLKFDPDKMREFFKNKYAEK
jgi:hypothetical protein